MLVLTLILLGLTALSVLFARITRAVLLVVVASSVAGLVLSFAVGHVAHF